MTLRVLSTARRALLISYISIMKAMVDPTSQRVCITSQSCTTSQLGNWPTYIQPDSNPGLLLGRQSCNHYTTRPTNNGLTVYGSLSKTHGLWINKKIEI